MDISGSLDNKTDIYSLSAGNKYTNAEFLELKASLLASYLRFTRFFYQFRTGREFIISQPVGRESHSITVAKDLTKIFWGDVHNEIINIPPRYGKTELLIHFVAWGLAHHADCNFLYISYSHNLATKQTSTIRDIVSLPIYKLLFDVEISQSSSAKDNFETTAGGSVYAAGIGGTITGRGAGVRGVTDRFNGALIIDDAHKPDEAPSSTIRTGVIDWYHNTAASRLNNGNKTPLIFIGQRVHEADLASELMKTVDNINICKIPVVDRHENVLDQRLHDLQALRKMQQLRPYEFAAQYQQDPQPAGGGLYKDDWFIALADEPKILATFITADTAETDKTYNDATVFSFWGLYEVKNNYSELGTYALHWLNCVELWCEPKDLENEFMQFYNMCMNYPQKPQIVAIEKKSTGVTLNSVLRTVQGLRVLDTNATESSYWFKRTQSKTTRFLAVQPYLSAHLVTFPLAARHNKMCIEHMAKITANDSHARDDIADTCADAVKIALIDKTVLNLAVTDTKAEAIQVFNIIKQQEESFHKKLQVWE